MDAETEMIDLREARGVMDLEAASTLDLVAELQRRERIALDMAIMAALPAVRGAQPRIAREEQNRD